MKIGQVLLGIHILNIYKTVSSQCNPQDLCFPNDYCNENCAIDKGVFCDSGVAKSISCHYQLGTGYNFDDCLMHLPNYTALKCSERKIQPLSTYYDFGDVTLETYIKAQMITHHQIYKTYIGVTFSKILWTDLQYRFFVADSKAVCNFKTVTITKNISNESVFSYYCPWIPGDYEGEQGYFELQYGTAGKYSTKMYTFFIPKHELLGKSENKREVKNFKEVELILFSYIEISNPSNPVLTIEINKEYNAQLNITHYDIVIHKTTTFTSSRVLVKTFFNEHVTSDQYQIIHSVDPIEETSYYFEIIPYNIRNRNTEYMTSLTPVIILPHTKFFKIWVYFCISSLLLILSMFSYLHYFKKSRQMNTVENENPKKNILFAYSPSHNAHINVIIKFRELLKNNFDVNIMLDCIDIPKWKDKDPSHWLSESFHCAQDIIFFISPVEETPIQIHPYRRLFELSINLTKHELSKKNSTKNFMVVYLPYSKDSISAILINFKIYYFFRDFQKFIKNIINEKFWQMFIDIEKRIKISELRNQFKSIVEEANKKIKNVEVHDTNGANHESTVEILSLINTENNEGSVSVNTVDENTSNISDQFCDLNLGMSSMDQILNGQKIQDSDDLICEETQDSDDLICQETQDSDDLICQETQDSDDLIWQKTQDSNDLICQVPEFDFDTFNL